MPIGYYARHCKITKISFVSSKSKELICSNYCLVGRWKSVKLFNPSDFESENMQYGIRIISKIKRINRVSMCNDSWNMVSCHNFAKCLRFIAAKTRYSCTSAARNATIIFRRVIEDRRKLCGLNDQAYYSLIAPDQRTTGKRCRPKRDVVNHPKMGKEKESSQRASQIPGVMKQNNIPPTSVEKLSCLRKWAELKVHNRLR
jgi:hypothetical protein